MPERTKSQSEIMSLILWRRNKGGRVQVGLLCLQLIWVLENIRTRQQDTIKKNFSSQIVSGMLFGSVQHRKFSTDKSPFSSEQRVLG